MAQSIAMNIIDGNDIVRDVIKELKQEVQTMPGPKPTITFIRVGDDPASISYVNKKQKTAEKIGIESRLILLPENVDQKILFRQIDDLNNDSSVHGILIQAPLPRHICERETFNRVSAKKDVDGFSATNLGKLCQEDETGFIACTPAAIIEIIRRSKIKTEGKRVVVLGRSLIVGRPMALLMSRKGNPGNATVTICHSRTKNLGSILKSADIVIAAIGQPLFVKKEMINEKCTIIDVGINRMPDSSRKSGYRLVGDVDFDSVSAIAEKITPVPGGVGPMTVAMLMKNTIKAYKQLKQ